MCKKTKELSSVKTVSKLAIKTLSNQKKINKGKCLVLLNNFPSKTAYFQLNFISSVIEEALKINKENIDENLYKMFFYVVYLLSNNKKVNSDIDIIELVYKKEIKKVMNHNIKNLIIVKIFKQLSTLPSTSNCFYSLDTLNAITQIIDKNKILTSFQELQNKGYSTLAYFSSTINEIYQILKKAIPYKEQNLLYQKQKNEIEQKIKYS